MTSKSTIYGFDTNLVESSLAVQFVKFDPTVAGAASRVESFECGTTKSCEVVAAVMNLIGDSPAESTMAIVNFKGVGPNGLPQFTVEIALVSSDPEVPEKLPTVLIALVGPVFNPEQEIGETLGRLTPAMLKYPSDCNRFVKKMRPTIERAVVPEELFIRETFH